MRPGSLLADATDAICLLHRGEQAHKQPPSKPAWDSRCFGFTFPISGVYKQDNVILYSVFLSLLRLLIALIQLHHKFNLQAPNAAKLWKIMQNYAEMQSWEHSVPKA